MSEKGKKYDVAIIGGGIGGLICGCSLVKKGLKVIIIERSSHAGGFCCFVNNKGFVFDAFAHSLGDLAKGAHLRNVLSQFGILNQLKLIHTNPSDVIKTPDSTVSFYNDIDSTVEDFIRVFPSEQKNIRIFFKEVLKKNKLDSVAAFYKKTFHQLLTEYFSNERLRQILGVPILGNLGVSARRCSAFSAVKHYKQFMLDGGYYPREGMGALSNLLANKFQAMGGELILGRPVDAIQIRHNQIAGLTVRGLGFIQTRFVASDSDARETVFNLLGKEHVPQKVRKQILSMKPSLSLFVGYIGVAKVLALKKFNCINNWIITNYHYDRHIYCAGRDFFRKNKLPWIMTRLNSFTNTCVVYTTAPLLSENFWGENKRVFLRMIIDSIKKQFSLTDDEIQCSFCLSPVALEKWTLNYQGAAYGWECSPQQIFNPLFSRDNIIPNLFFCGHWSTIATGIPGVATVGERVSDMIQKRYEINN